QTLPRTRQCAAHCRFSRPRLPARHLAHRLPLSFPTRRSSDLADVKRQIANTLLQLLEKKSLEKITVKELVALCGISRQTFYYHFEDVLDVVDWWTRQGAQQLMEESMRTDDPRKALRLFVDYTTEHRRTLQHILAG